MAERDIKGEAFRRILESSLLEMIGSDRYRTIFLSLLLDFLLALESIIKEQIELKGK